MGTNSSFGKLANQWFAFGRADGGNITILFAVALIPVVGLVGAAIDYTRASAIRTSLQAAVDSTALAVSRDAPSQTAGQLQAAAQAYFNALFTNQEAKGVQVAASYTASGGSQVTVTASASVKPKFMSMAPFGFSDMPVGVSSTTAWGMSRLRVALVLDNTGSMASAGKMDALKTATKNLLNQLKAAATSNGDVYVSIIPFSKDVNAGKSNYTGTWIDWTEWNAANNGANASMSGTICYNGTLYQVNGTSWITGGKCTGLGSGICYNGSLYQWNGSNFYIASTCNSNNNHANWNGCVTDRGNSTGPSSGNYDTNVVAPTSTITATLFPAEQYTLCPQPVMGLSYNWSAMNTLVDNMTPKGTTNQAIGLAWGWLSLVGGGPLTAPAKDPKYQYQEIIIILSDGLNTQDRWYISQNSIDARQTMTCSNIKAAGITLYTIQVNTDGDPTSTLLKNCASSADKFFLLTSANAIVTTFNTIGTNLSRLRVAK